MVEERGGGGVCEVLGEGLGVCDAEDKADAAYEFEDVFAGGEVAGGDEKRGVLVLNDRGRLEEEGILGVDDWSRPGVG